MDYQDVSDTTSSDSKWKVGDTFDIRHEDGSSVNYVIYDISDNFIYACEWELSEDEEQLIYKLEHTLVYNLNSKCGDSSIQCMRYPLSSEDKKVIKSYEK